MHGQSVDLRKAAILGIAAGMLVSLALAVVRVAHGPGVGSDWELDYLSFVELALAPSAIFVSLSLDSSGLGDGVVALVLCLVGGGMIYGVLALATAGAWRFKRGAGVLVLCALCLWPAFWLLAGVGCAEVVPR